jgi:hypothetical protein
MEAEALENITGGGGGAARVSTVTPADPRQTDIT